MISKLLSAVIIIISITLNAQVTKLGASVNQLSHFIASESFSNLKTKMDDFSQLDLLYIKSLQESNNDVGDALFNLTFTVIPYNQIPLVTPLLNIPININLPHSVDSIFRLKNKNLPKNLFYDSPQNDFGDKDKLAHFFGSAYISYGSYWFDFTEIIGIFVEDFEEKFYIQAKVDQRDLCTDYLGNIFGKALKNNISLLPSQILAAYHLTFFSYNL